MINVPLRRQYEPSNAQQTQGDRNQTTNVENLGQGEFGQCVDTCIRDNYGQTYETAKSLSPLSVVGAVANEVTEVLDGRLERTAVRNSYGNNREFRTAQRQLRTLSQFRKFNAANAVIGAGAAGFQAGALGYCTVSCLDTLGGN